MPRYHRQITFRARVLVGATVGATLVLAGCGSSDPVLLTSRVLVQHANEPVAFANDREHRLVYAERLTGSVRRLDTANRLEVQPVAVIKVSTDGQRGLLGLAVDATDRTFTASTEATAEMRIVVTQVAPGPARVVWLGPKSGARANGGHLEMSGDGRSLILGIGEIAGRNLERIEAPPKGMSEGRMLQLDPDGLPTQTPKVLSSGWHNPFAFTVQPGGQVWVADNAPDGVPERIARGDVGPGPTEVASLTREMIPTAIAQNSLVGFYACFLTDSTLRRVDTTSNLPGPIVTKAPCTRALYRSPRDGQRVVFSTEDTIYEFTDPCCRL